MDTDREPWRLLAHVYLDCHVLFVNHVRTRLHRLHSAPEWLARRLPCTAVPNNLNGAGQVADEGRTQSKLLCIELVPKSRPCSG